MLGKKQITAKNAKKKPRRSFVCFAFLAVTMQFMGAMSDEGKQLHAPGAKQLMTCRALCQRDDMG